MSIAAATSSIRRLAKIVRETIDECWRFWQNEVHWSIRWAVYGALLGFGTYLVLGFGPAGVVAGSPAAWIQASIGNVKAGSAFATMQSLGATGSLKWIMTLGGAVGLSGLRGLVELIRRRFASKASKASKAKSM